MSDSKTNFVQKVLVIVACVLILMALGLDMGKAILPISPQPGKSSDASASLGVAPVHNTPLASATPQSPPGLGIQYLAFLDVLLLPFAWLMISGLLIPDAVQSRTIGPITLIVMLLLIIGTVLGLIVAVIKLFLMISLLLAIPFGTMVYLALFGFFNTGAATAIIGCSLSLKLAFVVCALIAQPRYITYKQMMLMIATCLLGNLLLSFLQGFVPSILVSITDDIGAIVIAVLALIWGLIVFIESIPATIKALRFDRMMA